MVGRDPTMTESVGNRPYAIPLRVCTDQYVNGEGGRYQANFPEVVGPSPAMTRLARQFDGFSRLAQHPRNQLEGTAMMNIRLVGEQIGVEVSGIDVKTMSDADFAKIYQAWIDHNILVVKGQDLTIPDFLVYSRRFGIVNPHPSKSTRHPDYPDITMLGVGKFDSKGQLNEAIYRRGAEGWHTDGAYDEVPFKATQLYALANPEDRDWQPVFHPIVRTHRESGRKSLYFDPGKIVYFQGMSDAENEDLIKELTGYMIQPAGEYRHKWAVGDIVIWDNRCSYHKAAGDYPPDQDRIHWRVSIKDWEEAGKMAAE